MESEEPVIPANDTTGEGPSSLQQQAPDAEALPPLGLFTADPGAARPPPAGFAGPRGGLFADEPVPPPHPAQFYPPSLYAHSRQPLFSSEGAMPASPSMEPFLPPPPPPVNNPYASPPKWMYQQQTPSLGMDQSPSRFYQQQRPPNPVPGPAFMGPNSMPGPSFMAPNPVSGPVFMGPYGPYCMPGRMNFNASFDGQGGMPQFAANSSFGAMPNAQAAKELLSPSGVTGSSMQVHAPSSPPPIDMSGSIQPSTLSASHLGNPATSAAVHVEGAAGGHRTQVDTMVGGEGAVGKMDEAEGRKDGGESMSSLPMSVPEGTR